MVRWRRMALAILAIPVLVLVDATPQAGADRRLSAVVRVLQWLLRIYIIMCLAVWFWNGPGLAWQGNGLGPFLDPIFRVHEWFAVAVISTLSLFLLLVGLTAFGQVLILLWQGQQAWATVVADANPTARPRFQFTDQNGQTHVVSEPVLSFNSRFQPDQQVPLIYLPAHPETFFLNRYRDKWGTPLLFLLIGLILLFPCVMMVGWML